MSCLVQPACHSIWVFKLCIAVLDLFCLWKESYSFPRSLTIAYLLLHLLVCLYLFGWYILATIQVYEYNPICEPAAISYTLCLVFEGIQRHWANWGGVNLPSRISAGGDTKIFVGATSIRVLFHSGFKYWVGSLPIHNHWVKSSKW